MIVDGAWGAWTSYSDCSATCGEGYQTRTRTCDDPVPQYGGANCTMLTGSSFEVESENQTILETFAQSCTIVPCPSKYYYKKMTHKDAVYIYIYIYICLYISSNGSIVIVDGDWGSWGPWDAYCPVTCGGGNKTRTRLCDNPEPQYGGLNCTLNGIEQNSETELEACNEFDCPPEGSSNGKYYILDLSDVF